VALDFRGLLDTAARTMSTGMVIAEVPSGRILFKNQETDRIFGEVAPDVQLFADFDGAERFAPTLQLAANQDEGDAGSLGNYTTIPRNARLPVWSAIETGQLLRFENLAALKDAYLDAPVRSNYKAWAVIPFAVGGRGVGAVSFSFEHERTFSEEDRGMLMALSGQASLAFARCMLLDAERRVRADAEAARARERQLHELAARLSSALTPEQVASAACEEAGGAGRALGRHRRAIRRRPVPRAAHPGHRRLRRSRRQPSVERANGRGHARR
jgi:GAF domain-containing protein